MASSLYFYKMVGGCITYDSLTKPNIISLYILSYVCAFNKPTLTKNK